VEVVNQIKDKLGKVDESLRRLGNKLITWAETVREETEREKVEKRKDKGKRKTEEKMEIDGPEGEVIKIGDLDIEKVEE